MPEITKKKVKLKHKGVTRRTVATLSTAELEALRAGTLPQVVMLNDMDDVHNIYLGGISIAALQRLIQWGCCFDGDGQKITDVNASVSHVAFNIFQRPLQEYLGSVFQKLRLLPMVGTQRLAMSNREEGPDGLLYQQAKLAAMHCGEIQAFQHFNEIDIESVHQAIFTELRRRFFEDIGGIPGYLSLAERTHDITDRFLTTSLKYQYVQKALKCHAKLRAIFKPEFFYGGYAEFINLINELDLLKVQLSTGYSLDIAPSGDDELVVGKIYLQWQNDHSIAYIIAGDNNETHRGYITTDNLPELVGKIGNPLRLNQLKDLLPQILEIASRGGHCIRKATMAVPDFSASVAALSTPQGLTDENLCVFRDQALAHMAVRPAFIVNVTPEERQLVSRLDDAFLEIQEFAIRAVGESYADSVIDHAVREGSANGFLHHLREHYIKLAQYYQGESLNYFQALWDLYIAHVQDSYDVINDNYLSKGDRSALEQKIAGLRVQHTNVQSAEKTAIEAKFDLTRMQDFLLQLFRSFSMPLTNGSKAIIADETIRYLRSIDISVSGECMLKDDKPNYGVTFVSEGAGIPDRAFIHADKSALFRSYYRKDGKVELDAMIDSDMVEPEIEELLSLRPPLIVLATLAMTLVSENAGRPDLNDQPEVQEALRDYKQKIAVNLANHTLFDTELVACLISDTENLAAFKDSMLNRLVEQAQQLTTDPVGCNRFAAQFFNYTVSNLDCLPLLARDMLQQARIMTPNINPAFLLARLLKAICSDIKAFYPVPVDNVLVPDFEPSAEVQAALKKVAESLGMIGLEGYAGQENVLSAYGAYEQTDEQKTLMLHMNTMIDPNALRKIEGALTVEQERARGAAAAVEVVVRIEPAAPFEFCKNKETHYLSEDADERDAQVYDQFFYTGPDGNLQPLAGNVRFKETERLVSVALQDVDDEHPRRIIKEFSIYAVVAPTGLLISGHGALTTDMKVPRNGSIATIKITSNTDSVRIVEITSTGLIGFNSRQHYEQSFYSWLMGDANTAVLTENAHASADEIRALLKAYALSLNLDKLSQTYYYRMACMIVDYLRHEDSITTAIFLDSLRILSYLNHQSQQLQPRTFDGIAEVLGFVASPSQYSLDLSRMESKVFIWKLFAATASIGVLIMGQLPSNVTSPDYFEFFYDIEIENLLNEYVFPTLKVAVALGYSWFAAFCLITVLKIRDAVKYGRASQEQREIDSLVSRLPTQTRFQQAIAYLRNVDGDDRRANYEKLRLPIASMQQLQAMYETVGAHQNSVSDHHFMRYVTDPSIMYIDQNRQLMTRWERKMIAATTVVKSFLLLAPVIGAYFIKQGRDTLNSTDVQGIADAVIQGLLELAVILGGSNGLYLMMPIATLVLLLPEDSLVKMWRGLSYLTSCCLPENQNPRQIGRATLPGISFFENRHDSSDSRQQRTGLLEPLLPAENLESVTASSGSDTIVEMSNDDMATQQSGAPGFRRTN